MAHYTVTGISQKEGVVRGSDKEGWSTFFPAHERYEKTVLTMKEAVKLLEMLDFMNFKQMEIHVVDDLFGSPVQKALDSLNAK